MADSIKNFAYSTVATAPSPATSGTSLVVAAGDGSKFAVGNAVCWPANVQPSVANAEIVRVTVISTDTLTITRAQEGSTAQSVAVGWQIDQGVTAALLAQYVQKSGDAMTGALAMGANKITGLANGSAATDAAAFGQIPAGVSPATTVTGPDAFGAAAVVGTGSLFARNDHNHGLPAAPATNLTTAYISGAGTLTGTTTTFATTPALAIGKWLLNVTFYFTWGTAAPANANAQAQVANGTATATYLGANSLSPQAGVATTGEQIYVSVAIIATVTVAGTLLATASGLNLGTSPVCAAYIMAVKIA